MRIRSRHSQRAIPHAPVHSTPGAKAPQRRDGFAAVAAVAGLELKALSARHVPLKAAQGVLPGVIEPPVMTPVPERFRLDTLGARPSSTGLVRGLTDDDRELAREAVSRPAWFLPSFMGGHSLRQRLHDDLSNNPSWQNVMLALTRPQIVSDADAAGAAAALRRWARHADALTSGLAGTPPTAATIRALSENLVELASMHLVAQGVGHEVIQIRDGQLQLRVTAGDDTPLNRLAAGLESKWGTRLLYVPEAVLTAGGWEMFSPDDNAVLLGAGDLLGGQPTELLLHELMHAGHANRRDRGVNDPSLGLLETEGPRGNWLYANRQSADESAAYALTLRKHVAALAAGRDASEGHLPPRLVIEATANNGLETSVRSCSAAGAALTALDRHVAPSYSTRPGAGGKSVTWAQLALSGQSTLDIPLVGSAGTDDPANERLLRSQLVRLRETSRVNVTLFRVAERYLVRLAETDARADRQALSRAMARVAVEAHDRARVAGGRLDYREALELFHATLSRSLAA